MLGVASMSAWDFGDVDDAVTIQARRKSHRRELRHLNKHVSPRVGLVPGRNLASTSPTARSTKNSTINDDNGGVVTDIRARRGQQTIEVSTGQRDLAPLVLKETGGLALRRLTPSSTGSRRSTSPVRHSTQGTPVSPSGSTSAHHNIEAREVVHGAWPRPMTLKEAVVSLTDPKCVIDQQCHLAFLLCLPCFATAHAAQPLFQHEESIQCILYNSVDEFVRHVEEQFLGGEILEPPLQGTPDASHTSIATTIDEVTSSIATEAGVGAARRPHIKTIIRRAKVMKLLSLWISQRGGETDLTNHHTARAVIVNMLSNCPSLVPRNRTIANGLIEKIRVVNQNSLRTVVTIVHALHQRVGRVVAPKILGILKAKLAERFGERIVEYHWDSIVEVLQENPTRTLHHLKHSTSGAPADGTTGGRGPGYRSMEAEIIQLPKPWWEYTVDADSRNAGGNPLVPEPVVWRSTCSHIVVRDHPTRWSFIIRRLTPRDEVREITRIYVDFHYWIRVFVLDDCGDLQAGWVCIDNYFDAFNPDFSCAATREMQLDTRPSSSSSSIPSHSSVQGGRSLARRSSSRGLLANKSVRSSLNLGSHGSSDALLKLYHNVPGNATIAKEHDLSSSLLASIIMNPRKHNEFAKVLAAQLTLIDVGVLKRMQLRELIGQRWTKKFKNVESPYVLELTRDYNNRVSWVVRILQGKTHKYRRLAYTFMVQVADELLQSGNFNAAGQIGHGFASPALGKLDIFTNRSEKSKPAAVALQKRIEFLKILFHDKDNYMRYRLEFESREEECAFLIPCWGIFLGDLFKLDDKESWIVGQCSQTGSPLLNLPKASLTYSTLAQTLRVAEMTGARTTTCVRAMPLFVCTP